ncbi:hypothetical protein BKA81DRAFT_358028 [Phyllosticta paracitricarpa]|uniref:Uncharacterized protein n=1 Tax=Phyllosticta citricarpa TaxID=55181 RepID=A0ABR1M699_9PEZI
MAFNGYVNRRSVLFFAVASLTGSYLIAKSNTVRAKTAQMQPAQQKEVGKDFGVDTSRSGRFGLLRGLVAWAR